MAERLDVTEELVRLETHLGHLGEILKGKGAVGRKLDFVVQEIGRELNTVASKAQDAEMAARRHRRQGGARKAARAGPKRRVRTARFGRSRR